MNEKTRSMPSRLKQMDYCLQLLASKIEAAGGTTVNYHSCSDEIQAATLLKNDGETRLLVMEIRDLGWIKFNGVDVQILYEGHQRLKELRRTKGESEKTKTRPMPSRLEQMDYCLQLLASKIEAAGGTTVNYRSCSNEIQAATLLKNKGQTRLLVIEIRDLGWIKFDGYNVQILHKGHQRLKELRRTKGESE